MADEVEQEKILLPEHTTEDYDEVIYQEVSDQELEEPPKTVADFLWRTINYHLSPTEYPNRTKPPTTKHDYLFNICPARARLMNRWPAKYELNKYIPSPCQPTYTKAEKHIFSLDTKRNYNDNFQDCEDQQGARYMYGYLAYLVALDEGL